MPADKEDQLAFDRLKLAVDSIKHITTLATGTIVLSATFIDKFPKPTLHKLLFLVSIVCMFVSLLCSAALLHGVSVKDYWAPNSPNLYTEGSKTGLRAIILAVYYSFGLGIAALGSFAVLNLYAMK